MGFHCFRWTGYELVYGYAHKAKCFVFLCQKLWMDCVSVWNPKSLYSFRRWLYIPCVTAGVVEIHRFIRALLMFYYLCTWTWTFPSPYPLWLKVQCHQNAHHCGTPMATTWHLSDQAFLPKTQIGTYLQLVTFISLFPTHAYTPLFSDNIHTSFPCPISFCFSLMSLLCWLSSSSECFINVNVLDLFTCDSVFTTAGGLRVEEACCKCRCTRWEG